MSELTEDFVSDEFSNIQTWENLYKSYLMDYEDWGTVGNLDIALKCLHQVICIRQKKLKEKYCE